MLMADALLWDLKETAHQLGNVSTRTVQRLVARGDIATKKVGRRRMVIAASVIAWLDGDMPTTHTGKRVGRDVRGVKACQKHAGKKGTASTAARTRQTTGPVISTRAARELDDLLAPATKKKPRQRLRNGESKRVNRSTGVQNPPGSLR